MKTSNKILFIAAAAILAGIVGLPGVRLRVREVRPARRRPLRKRSWRRRRT